MRVFRIEISPAARVGFLMVLGGAAAGLLFFSLFEVAKVIAVQAALAGGTVLAWRGTRIGKKDRPR